MVAGMFLRPNRRLIDGETYEYWTLVKTVRTAKGPRQEIVATLGKEPGLEEPHAAWLGGRGGFALPPSMTRASTGGWMCSSPTKTSSARGCTSATKWLA